MSLETVVAIISSQGVIGGRVQPNTDILTEEGFLIVDKKKLELSEAHARELFPDDDERSAYTNGPVVAFLLKRTDAFARLTAIKNELDDLSFTPEPYSALRNRKLLFPDTPTLERTLVIIKPDYSQDDYTAVLEAIDRHDFVVVGKTGRMIPADVARTLLGDQKDDIKYITQDMCVTVVLEKIGAVDEWQLIMGPEDAKLAKEIAPNSLRARLGHDKTRNAVYGSPSVEKAKREIELLFPAPFPIERTLAIVKPDAFRHLDAIMHAVEINGFTVIASDKVYLSKQRAEQLYSRERTKSFFDDLTSYISSGPCQVFILSKPAAIDAWRKLIGPSDLALARREKPNSLRALFGTGRSPAESKDRKAMDDDLIAVNMNGLHGSDNVQQATEEIDAFFPQLPVERIPTLPEIKEIMRAKPPPRPFADSQKSLHDVLVEGLTQLCRVKPLGDDAVIWLSNWLLRNNPYKPFVEAPIEPVVSVALGESLSAASGRAVNVVWVVGDGWSAVSPGRPSFAQEACAQIAQDLDFEYVGAGEVLRAAQQSGSEYAEIIKKRVELRRAVPTHILVNLLRKAFESSRRTNFLLHGFPMSLDQSFDFEKNICAPNFLLYFKGAEAKADELDDRDPATRALRNFQEEIEPVLEHYRVFNKVQTVECKTTEQALRDATALVRAAQR